MIEWIVKAWCKWRERRYWNAERQLEHLREMVLEDWRFTMHHPIANAYTTRYKRALSKDWYRMEHDSAEVFRRKLDI